SVAAGAVRAVPAGTVARRAHAAPGAVVAAGGRAAGGLDGRPESRRRERREKRRRNRIGCLGDRTFSRFTRWANRRCSRRHRWRADDMTCPGAIAFPAALDEIRARAAESPRRPAVALAGKEPVSYAALIERIDRLAERIEQKAPPASVVALLLPNGPD